MFRFYNPTTTQKHKLGRHACKWIEEMRILHWALLAAAVLCSNAAVAQELKIKKCDYEIGKDVFLLDKLKQPTTDPYRVYKGATRSIQRPCSAPLLTVGVAQLLLQRLRPGRGVWCEPPLGGV